MTSLRVGTLSFVALLALLALGAAEASAQTSEATCVGLSEGAVCTDERGEQGRCARRDDGTDNVFCDAGDEAVASGATGVGGGEGSTSGTGTDDGGDVPGRACALGAPPTSSGAFAVWAGLALVAATRRLTRRHP